MFIRNDCAASTRKNKKAAQKMSKETSVTISVEEEELREFTQDVSLHGCRFIMMKSVSIARRIYWMLIIMAGLAYLAYAVYQLSEAFTHKRLISMIKTRNQDIMKFPTVTICNRNYWRRSAIIPAGMSAEDEQEITSLVADAFLFVTKKVPSDRYNWSSEALKSVSANVNLTEERVQEIMMYNAHQINSTFEWCSVLGSIVNCSDIIKQQKTDAGICFQFNADGTQGTHRPGSNGGVTFLLDAEVDEYFVGPLSYAEGFMVAVHDKDDVPGMSEQSYATAIGTKTIISVSRLETIKQPPPADYNTANCFDAEKYNNPLHNFPTYTFNGCVAECLTAFIINKCGCRQFLNPKLNGTDVCSFRIVLECANPAKTLFYQDPSHLKSCDCKSSCHEISYTATTSSATYPSYSLVGRRDRSEEWYRYMKKNGVLIDISYSKMSDTLLEERLQYKPLDLISSLGGSLGVCLGASLLSVVELVEFAALFVYKLIRNRTRKNVKPEHDSHGIVVKASGNSAWTLS